jgi:hypothetical protein
MEKEDASHTSQNPQLRIWPEGRNFTPAFLN